jgi:hypothetical protein
MATETEELKLRITLEDGVTAQLARVRQEMSQMAGGQTGQGLQNITAKTDEATKAFGSLARQGLAVGQTTTNFAKVLGPLPVTLGVLAYEFVRQLAGMKEWAGQMVAINNAARMAGVSIGQFRGIQMGLRQSGISAQEAAGMMQSLTRTLSEANRPGSAVREGLIRMAGPQFAGAMMESINKLGQMRDATDRVNYIRQMGLNVYANNFNRTHDEMQARYAQYIFLQQFGMEKLINQKKEIAHLDQRTVDNMTDEAAKQDALNEALATEEATRNRIWDIVKGSMADYELGVVSILTKIESHVARDLEQGAASRREYVEKEKAGKAPPITATPIPNVPSPATGFQHGGIVTKPTLGLVGEAGPEAIIPLSQVSGITTTSIKHTESVGENTKQLRMLNDQMEQILNPSMISRYSAGMGGAGPGGNGGGASGYGPGGTQGAAPGVPNIPGTPGGPAIDMSSARMGLNPMWDDPTVGSAANRPGTWGAAAMAGGTESHAAAPPSSWPAQAVGGGLGTAKGGGNITAGAGGTVNPNELFESYVSHFKGSKLDGFIPKDGAMFGITSGSPEEWARLAIATSKQESGLNANARGGGLNQFEAADLRRYGVRGNVNDPNAQVQALSNQWISAIPRDGVVSGPGGGKRWGGASAYFGSIRAGWNARGGSIDIMKHMKWAGGIAAQEAGTTPTTTTGVAPPARFAGYGPFGIAGVGAAPGAVGGAAPAAGGPIQPGAPTAPGALQSATGAPQAFIVHHTGPGITTTEQLLKVLHDRGGLGVEFTQLPSGEIVQVGQPGAANIRPEDMINPKTGKTYGTELGAKLKLRNQNIVGIEVMAANDAAVKQENAQRLAEWIQTNYPQTPVYGHGEIQRDKEPDEGRKVVNIVRAMRAAAANNTQVAATTPTSDAAIPSPWDTAAEDSRATLDRMMGKETQHDVDTSGTITIKHDAKAAEGATKSKLPPFKEVPTNRQATMESAHDGPQAPNPASGV